MVRALVKSFEDYSLVETEKWTCTLPSLVRDVKTELRESGEKYPTFAAQFNQN